MLVDGERLLDHAVRVLAEGGCVSVFAVVRPGTMATAQVIVNHEPERGMRSSLERAAGAACHADALAMLLVDLPGVSAQAVETVRNAWRLGRIAMADHAGHHGHPVVMAPDLLARRDRSRSA